MDKQKKCEITKDLLPLYADEICSQSAREFVEEHLKECEDCRQELEDYRYNTGLPEPGEDERDVFVKFSKKLKKRNIIKVVVSVFGSLVGIVVTAFLAIGLFGTFDMASGGCAGGYGRWLYDTQIDEIKEVVPGALDEYDLGEIKFNLSYDGRTCQTEYTDENGEIVKLSGKLRWYWGESIKWQVEE